MRRSVAPVKAPLLVAEVEQALGQRRRDAAAVEDHEGSVAAVAGLVDRARRDVLARARLSEEQDAEGSGGDLGEDAEHAAHLRRRPDEGPESVEVPDLDAPLGLRLDQEGRAAPS